MSLYIYILTIFNIRETDQKVCHMYVVVNWEPKSVLHVVENWDGVQLAVVALADDWRTPLLAH